MMKTFKEIDLGTEMVDFVDIDDFEPYWDILRLEPNDPWVDEFREVKDRFY